MRAAAICVLAIACLQAGAASAIAVPPNHVRSSSFDRCPGGREWWQSRLDEQRAERMRPMPTNPALRDRLVALAAGDMEGAAHAAADAADAAAAAAADAAVSAGEAGSNAGRHLPPASPRDAARLARLQVIIDGRKPPTAAEIGRDGMDALISIVEEFHSQPQFQLRLGEALLGARDQGVGHAFKRRTAEMVDRALDDLDKPQRYGTLFTRDEQNRIVLQQPVESEAGLEARRAVLDLVPLPLEICMRRDSDSSERWPPFF
ncbi:hypothetical protein [Luteimonas sp. R10]|uniref:hypothetical protein n=1 Tax=Luteimonas sp. R10 TaxID=3108176 RepID=UPI00308C90F6|nr:hypothetical protein U3649_05510 [Luteimonas sp. R10]